MLVFRLLVLALVFAATITAVPSGGARAQCDAYTDEMAGPGGTYGNPAACNAVEETTELVPEGVVGVGGAIGERNATARDNPDAPPVDRHTATFEGESEP